jgi:hypothetical protein
MRRFNVFSELVVSYPGETFLWVVNAAEIPTGSTSVTVSSNSWPLTQGAYVVTPGTGTQATAENSPGADAIFSCTPPAPNNDEQSMVIAAQAPSSVCTDVNVAPGEYFIWDNQTNHAITIKPDENNKNYWPLPGEQHVVPANGWSSIQIPGDAEEGEYTLVVASEGNAVCPENAQPKIIIQSGI